MGSSVGGMVSKFLSGLSLDCVASVPEQIYTCAGSAIFFMSIKLSFYSFYMHSVGINCMDVHGVVFFVSVVVFVFLVFMNCVIGAY